MIYPKNIVEITQKVDLNIVIRYYSFYVQEVIMKKELIISIKEKELQLAKLKMHLDKSSICNELYNKIVLEKAILKKQLEESSSSGFCKKIRNIIPRKKTLICDYFKD